MSFFDNILGNIFGKAPKAPDYTGAAEATAAADKALTTQQSYANRPDQVTPFGVQRWGTTSEIDPATGEPVDRWTQLTQLTPEMQDALSSQQRIDKGLSNTAESMLGNATAQYGKPIDYSGITPGGKSSSQFGGMDHTLGTQTGDIYYGDAHQITDPATLRKQMEDATYTKATSRLDPQWQQQQSDLDVQLRNQGLKPGDEAYDRAYKNMSQAKNDAYGQAQLDSVINSGNQAQQQFNQDVSQRGIDEGDIDKRLAARQAAAATQNQIADQQFQQGIQGGAYDTTQRQQQIAEMLGQRGAGLNELNAVLNGQQVSMPNMPDFSQVGKSAAPNYSLAAQQGYDANVNNYAAGQNQRSALTQAIGSFF